MVDAKVVDTLSNIFTCLLVALFGRRSIVWREFVKITLLVIPGMLLGFYLFYQLELNFLLYIYGSVIIIAIKSFFTPSAPRPLSLPLTVLIMTEAGLMQWQFVSGGAFVVIYAVRVFRDKAEFRATLSLLWVVLNVVILLEILLAGELNRANVIFSLLLVIPTMLEVYLGNILHRHIGGRAFCCWPIFCCCSPV